MTEVTSTKELALQEALDFASRCGQKSDSWTAQACPRGMGNDGKSWINYAKLWETVRNCEANLRFEMMSKIFQVNFRANLRSNVRYIRSSSNL